MGIWSICFPSFQKFGESYSPKKKRQAIGKFDDHRVTLRTRTTILTEPSKSEDSSIWHTDTEPNVWIFFFCSGGAKQKPAVNSSIALHTIRN
jgi:hypothetical protein